MEQEIALSRKAFILGLPTAISFGIVSVGERYGAMFELVDAVTISKFIARNPGRVERYAKTMAELAHTIHSILVPKSSGFPDALERIQGYINGGVRYEDEVLAGKCLKLLDTISGCNNLIHGDFHTGNVFLQNGEPLLIDMDRISTGHPILEIGDLYFFYVVLGEDDPSIVENYMGFSYDTACKFFRCFLNHYLNIEDEERLEEVTEKAEFLCRARLVYRFYKNGQISKQDRVKADSCKERLAVLTEKLDTLTF